MSDLTQKRIFALDMDGTIYLGQTLFPFTPAFLAGLNARGKDFIFLTNNSSKSPEDYQQKLARMGLEVSLDTIYTSGQATIEYLLPRSRRRAIYLLGTPELARQFEAAGFRFETENPEFVVLGFDKTFTYEKLDLACRLVRRGVPFVATHPDFNCPLEGGQMEPDCGALAAAITAATGVTPKVMGKPHPEMLKGLLRRLNAQKEDLALVGDRLMTDIQMGQNFGIFTILVLTGEARRADLVHSAVQPDLVVERNVDVLGYLGGDENKLSDYY